MTSTSASRRARDAAVARGRSREEIIPNSPHYREDQDKRLPLVDAARERDRAARERLAVELLFGGDHA